MSHRAISTSKFSIWIDVEPAPASRPKVSRYGVRYAKSHMQYQHDFKKWYLGIAKDTQWPRYGTALCEVSLDFIATKAKTSKLLTPRWDIDNAAKLTLDCFTSIAADTLWTDDVTISKLNLTKRFAGPDEAAGTLLRVGLAKP